MIVRLANFDTDALGILEGTRDFVSRMGAFEFLPENIDEIVAKNVTADFIETAVIEHEGNIVGALGMAYLPFIWNPKLTSAEELFFWTSKSSPNTAALQLLRFVGERIKTKGRSVVTFRRLMTSPASLDRVYRRMGLKPVETNYMGIL